MPISPPSPLPLFVHLSILPFLPLQVLFCRETGFRTIDYKQSEEEVRGRRKMKHKFIVEEVVPSRYLTIHE